MTKKNKLTIYYTYSEDFHVIEDTYEEHGPYSGYCEEDISYSLLDVYLENPSNITPHWESLDIDVEYVPSKLYLVLVKYTTGGTFGSSYGNGIVVAAFENRKDASQAKTEIHEGTWNRSPHGYNCWEGYFESLDDVSVEERQVLVKAKSDG